MMSRFCEKCGYQLGEGAAFCENCGAPISVSSPPAVGLRTPSQPQAIARQRVTSIFRPRNLALAGTALLALPILNFIVEDAIYGYTTDLVFLLALNFEALLYIPEIIASGYPSPAYLTLAGIVILIAAPIKLLRDRRRLPGSRSAKVSSQPS